MIMSASFEVGTVQIPISNELAITTISLSMVDGEELSISGLPRALLAKKVAKGISTCLANRVTKVLNIVVRQHYLHLPTNIMLTGRRIFQLYRIQFSNTGAYGGLYTRLSQLS